MDRVVANQIIVDVLSAIAPEIDASTVDGSSDLQFEFDLDSMDFLNLVEGVAAATGREIPERDYAAVTTLDRFVDYLTGSAREQQH
jgi:acyl carrier protein